LLENPYFAENNMPRLWINAPRLFNGLIRPNINFFGRELSAWNIASPQGIPEPTLGLFSRRDGAFLLAIPGHNGNAEETPGAVPVAVFSFAEVDDAVEVRRGALLRLGGRSGQACWIRDRSVAQIIAAVRAEADELGLNPEFARVTTGTIPGSG
jgi:hypothetical protein